MTDPDHPYGTDRIVEVARPLELSDDDVVVDIQGDQPKAQEYVSIFW